MTESALVRYDAACRALAAAKRTDEALKIRNEHEALRAYAKQAKNRQLEIDATEIRIRAERRVGELIVEQKKTVGLNLGARGAGPGRGNKKAVVRDDRLFPPTLADAGIDKDLSSRSQKLAAVPDKQFERQIADWRAGAEQTASRVSTRLLPKRGRKPTPRGSRPLAVVETDTRPPSVQLYFRVMVLLSDELDNLPPVEQAEVLDLLSQAIHDLREQRQEVIA